VCLRPKNPFKILKNQCYQCACVPKIRLKSLKISVIRVLKF
jgi:hypothetical protein